MRIKACHLAVLNSLLLGCVSSTPPSVDPALSTELMAACAVARYEDSVTTPEYWKAGTFDPESDEFVRQWYSRQLCAMGELPLGRPTTGHVRVRFLWLRSFHAGIAVRIEHSLDMSRLLATELDGAGGYEPGGIARQVGTELSSKQWDVLQRELAQASFWQLPSPDPHIGGSDGAEWIVEIAEHNRYRVVNRWAGAEIESVGRLLLEFSGLDPNPIY